MKDSNCLVAAKCQCFLSGSAVSVRQKQNYCGPPGEPDRVRQGRRFGAVDDPSALGALYGFWQRHTRLIGTCFFNGALRPDLVVVSFEIVNRR
jgi:hypothetical protein